MTDPAAPTASDRVWAEDLEIVDPHYGVEDVPPPAETFFYAWQHTLVDVSPFVLPLVVARAVGYDEAQAAAMVSTCLALMGVFTFINATWGHRLPSVMGPSATLSGALASIGTVFGAPAMWFGAFCGGIFETIVGASGVLGSLRRVLTPLVCGLVVTTIGLSLARVAASWVFADSRPEVLGLAAATALTTVALLILGRRPGLGLLGRGAIFFALLSVGGLGGAWLGLLDTTVLKAAPWFALPSFGRFGLPGFGWEFVAGAVLGALIAVVGSVAESVGDYAGTCAVSRVPFTMRHIRRGITVEGISSTIAPLFGAIPLTTYSQNTGVIATTRVASRRVIQTAAVLLTIYGLCPKLGALLVVIPRASVGVVFLVVCGLITAAGIRLIAAGSKDDSASLIIALTLVPALVVPSAVAGKEWLGEVAPLLRLGLTNSVVIATVLGIGLSWLVGPKPSDSQSTAS